MIDFDSDDPVSVSEMRKFQECVVADLKDMTKRQRALLILNTVLYIIVSLEFILIEVTRR